MTLIRGCDSVVIVDLVWWGSVHRSCSGSSSLSPGTRTRRSASRGWLSFSSLGAGGGGSSAMTVRYAATVAKTAPAIAVSNPPEPTRSAANSIDVMTRRVWAAIPAAHPIAIAKVGDVPTSWTANAASPTPRKTAGKIGPPRNPAARLITYATALASTRTTSATTEYSDTRAGIEAWPENSTSSAATPNAVASWASRPTRSPPTRSAATVPVRRSPSRRSCRAARPDAERLIATISAAVTTPTTMAIVRSGMLVPGYAGRSGIWRPGAGAPV